MIDTQSITMLFYRTQTVGREEVRNQNLELTLEDSLASCLLLPALLTPEYHLPGLKQPANKILVSRLHLLLLLFYFVKLILFLKCLSYELGTSRRIDFFGNLPYQFIITICVLELLTVSFVFGDLQNYHLSFAYTL